jgi:hypothetical protein
MISNRSKEQYDDLKLEEPQTTKNGLLINSCKE